MGRILLTVFKDNKTKEIMRDLAFMKCPYCKKEILLDTDKVSFCKYECRKENKIAYKLNKNNYCPEGFDKVLYAKVKTFSKKILMEEFKNG